MLPTFDKLVRVLFTLGKVGRECKCMVLYLPRMCCYGPERVKSVVGPSVCSLSVVAVRSCYAAASMLCCAVLCWGKDAGDSVRLNEVLTHAGSAHSRLQCVRRRCRVCRVGLLLAAHPPHAHRSLSSMDGVAVLSSLMM